MKIDIFKREEEIKYGNELIDRYMNNQLSIRGFMVSEMNYHTDWNLLIEVVQMIQKEYPRSVGYALDDDEIENFTNLLKALYKFRLTDNIFEVFQVCYDLIYYINEVERWERKNKK